MIDFDPSEEQTLILETVRQFAENEIRPRARECDEGRKLPDGVLAQAHELGLVANSLPDEHGGGGERSAVTGCLIAEELAWGDLAIATAILSPALLGLPVADFGSERQKRKLLPPLCGPSFLPGSLATVEPRFDSDVLRPKTIARRDGDDYLIEGAKCFVPWLEGTPTLLISADDAGSAQLFLIAPDAAGLELKPETNLGLRGLPTAELALRDVRVPATARLGEAEGSDLRAVVDRGRIALAAMAVGVARAAYELSLDYAKERETFGAPIATRQAIAFKLADMAIEIDSARLLTWEAAWCIDQGRDATREATLACDKARRVALEVSDGAVQVFGGHGYIRDYLPEMHLRNAAGFASFEALALV